MKPQPASEKPLVFRPEKEQWWSFFIFAALALLPAFGIWSGAPALKPRNDVGAAVAFTVAFGVPALCIAWWLIRCRIVADARGLTFQGFFRRRFVAWNAIEDFELRFPTSNQSKSRRPRAHLRSGGKWRLLPESYQPRQLLLDCIAREAKWARATSWQLGETRDDGEWPKTFVYRDVSGWRLVGIYFLFTFTFFGLNFLNAATNGWAPILAHIAQGWSASSPWGRVGFVALPFLLCGLIPLVFLAQYPAIRARRAYLGHKIVARREGLTFHQNEAQTWVRWEEISAYHLETMTGHFAPTRCIVETRRAKFEFVSGITGEKILKTLIEERARSASTAKWRYADGADSDVLGGAASFYRGANLGVGPKIHHYRTRTTRIFLIFGLVMMGGYLVAILAGRLSNGLPASTADIATQIFMLLAISGATLGGLAAYFFASFRCEADALRQNGVWGERFLRWDEIETFALGASGYKVSGGKKAIRFGIFLADAQGLKEEVERRSGVTLQKQAQRDSD